MTATRGSESVAEPSRGGGISAGLFLASVGILTLEVLQTRLLSLQMWYHHAYVVVTLTLLGFAAAGTVVTVFPGLARRRVSACLAWCSLLFGLSVVASYLVLSAATQHVMSLEQEGNFGVVAGFYVLLVLPYLFGGMIITVALSAEGPVHRRYFWNLLGSALGAWVFILAIRPLGGERLLALAALSGPLSALVFLRGAPATLARPAAWLAALGLAVVVVFAEGVFPIEVGAGKMRFIRGEMIDRRWTPLSCLDLFRIEQEDGNEIIQIVQDGSAGTLMHSDEAWKSRDLLEPRSLPYVPALLRMRKGGEAPRVLVIGVGGGTDLRTAVDFGAESVTGLEINADMVQITIEDYADFNGGIGSMPGVSTVVGEGRSTLRRLDETFDIIIVSGTDTYTAGVSGSFVLSESYLYTEEAFVDYFDRLSPGGALAFVRFADDPPLEMIRLMGMGVSELSRRGIEEPSRHVAMIRERFSGGAVFSLTPFDEEAIAFYAKADTDPTGLHEVLYLPGHESEATAPFRELVAAIESGDPESFYAAHEMELRPVTDDSPFFFNFHHVLGSWEPEESAYSDVFDIHFPVAPKVLTTLLGQVSGLVLLLVLLPLVLLRRASAGNTRHAWRHLLYFLALGAGFMFLEISMIQRLALFLGHPVYSLTVTLFSFLFFAGLGSLITGRFAGRETGAMRASVAGLAVLALLLSAVLDPVQAALLHLPLGGRIAVAVALLAPMNLLMGMPFPLGLARLRATQPALVPWALGANGGASVIGSILAVMVAMETGFSTVALVAVGIYLLGTLAATSGPLGVKGGAGAGSAAGSGAS